MLRSRKFWKGRSWKFYLRLRNPVNKSDALQRNYYKKGPKRFHYWKKHELFFTLGCTILNTEPDNIFLNYGILGMARERKYILTESWKF